MSCQIQSIECTLTVGGNSIWLPNRVDPGKCEICIFGLLAYYRHDRPNESTGFFCREKKDIIATLNSTCIVVGLDSNDYDWYGVLIRITEYI